MFLLLKSKISSAELCRCQYDILKFVGGFQILYGEAAINYNIHTFLHIIESIKKCDPL